MIVFPKKLKEHEQIKHKRIRKSQKNGIIKKYNSCGTFRGQKNPQKEAKK